MTDPTVTASTARRAAAAPEAATGSHVIDRPAIGPPTRRASVPPVIDRPTRLATAQPGAAHRILPVAEGTGPTRSALASMGPRTRAPCRSDWTRVA